MNVLGRFVCWLIGVRREASASRPANEQVELLQAEVARLKKQIRAERIVDRGGRPPHGAVKVSARPIGDAKWRADARLVKRKDL